VNPRPIALALALFGALGLLAPRASVVVHAHEGGGAAHDHGGSLTAWVDRGGHGHRHAPGGHRHDPDPAPPSPTEVPDAPDGDDEHAHVRSTPGAALRRTNGTVASLCPPLAAQPPIPWWCCPVAAAATPTEQGSWRRAACADLPRTQARSTIERLVQGLGLRI
jgi:hypothetical protein